MFWIPRGLSHLLHHLVIFFTWLSFSNLLTICLGHGGCMPKPSWRHGLQNVLLSKSTCCQVTSFLAFLSVFRGLQKTTPIAAIDMPNISKYADLVSLYYHPSFEITISYHSKSLTTLHGACFMESALQQLRQVAWAAEGELSLVAPSIQRRCNGLKSAINSRILKIMHLRQESISWDSNSNKSILSRNSFPISFPLHLPASCKSWVPVCEPLASQGARQTRSAAAVVCGHPNRWKPWDWRVEGYGVVRCWPCSCRFDTWKLLQNECRNAIKNASALLPLQLSRANLSSKKLIQLKMWRYVFHWNSLCLQDLPNDSNATWPDQLQRDSWLLTVLRVTKLKGSLSDDSNDSRFCIVIHDISWTCLLLLTFFPARWQKITGRGVTSSPPAPIMPLLCVAIFNAIISLRTLPPTGVSIPVLWEKVDAQHSGEKLSIPRMGRRQLLMESD